MSQSKYWVYILKCEGNRYYTGYTNNLEKRYKAHVDGTSKCKFTRSFKPISIAQSWEILEKSQALKLERQIKKLSKNEKERLIANPNLALQT